MPKRTFAIPFALLITSCGNGTSSTDGGTQTSGTLTLSTIAAVTVGTTKTESSSSLRATWAASAANGNHVRLIATGGSDTFSYDAPAGATEFVLTGLHSSTTYKVEANNCNDASCTSKTSIGSSSLAVPPESWVVQGSGAGVSTATKVVSDGNVRIHGFAYGKEAPADLAGRIQLYYGPQPTGVKGLVVGAAKQVATSEISTLLQFQSLAGSSGVEDATSTTGYVQQINTGQAVPLGGALGNKVRLFFETGGPDRKTRIVYVDSADGYVGRDFNSGSSNRCQAETDYAAGGPCAASLAIGVSGDPGDFGVALPNVRQFKIGVRTLDDWRWSGEVGTFMWLTIDEVTGCTTPRHNQAYAVWDGAGWKAQKGQDGCPLVLTDAQAPSPLHLGGAHYKMYFGTPSDQTGKDPTSTFPFLGPKRVIYAHGARTGDANVVDYGDWDTREAARDVTFLWPDGTPLTAAEEGVLDDFVHLTPTSDLKLQVSYLAMTDGKQPPFPVLAVLANP